MTRLRISEHFFSIQGEGASVGVPAVFVRLQGCNLMCGAHGGDWVCDTTDVWKRGHSQDIHDWHHRFTTQYRHAFDQGAHLVITGGEPLLQQDALLEWLALFDSLPVIEIETNGTIRPAPSLWGNVHQWNVSPKLRNSGESMDQRWVPAILNEFIQVPNAIFKFVVQSESDVLEVMASGMAMDQMPIRRKFLMPAADNRTDLNRLYPTVIEWAKQYGFSLGQRFHISQWDQTTGI